MKIYFHLSGRLGNQLFQWAYLHELVEKDIEVVIFVDKYHNKTDAIDLEQLLSGCEHLPQVSIRNDLGLLLRIFEKLRALGGPFYKISKVLPIHIEESPTGKRGKLLPTIVEGYFVDKVWPQKHEKILVGELATFLNQIHKDQYLQEISVDDETTTVHVRRGDFKLFKNTFGLLSKEYYLSLLQRNQSVLVLTDSTIDASEIFSGFNKIQIIDPDKYDGWVALKIISESKRFLMSNSTLAWWGGYLALKLNAAEVVIPNPIYTQESDFDEKLTMPEFTTAKSIFE